MISIRIDHAWRVQATSSLELALSERLVWGQMRDLGRFITRDPLHAEVLAGMGRGHPWLGRAVTIRHRLLGVGPDRVGRVLKWTEGRGYAVSDLSQRGVRVGFPHVCFYRVAPLDGGGCTLTVSARGRWTATWLPRMVVRAWLWWVLKSTEVLIGLEMGRYRGWLGRRHGPDR